MESVNTKPNSKSAPVNRVILSEVTAAKLDSWAGQMEAYCPGIRLKRQHLVEWLVDGRDSQLTSSDQKSIKERCYDDIELATWALEQLKAAKARNEKVSLVNLLQGGKTNAGNTPRKPRKKKEPPKPANEAPQIEAPSGSGNLS